jgi:phage head maturation protease
MDDLLISITGGEVKSLGDRRFRGHLVLFSGPDDPDLTGDFFSAKTDFDFEDGERRSGYFKHGMDVKVGNRKVGRGVLTRDTKGVLLDGIIDERFEYAEDVWQAIEGGHLGLSSGAVSHLVRREKVAAKGREVYHVTHWPLGEWSFTPAPAEPRTQVMAVKTYLTGLGDGEYRQAALKNSGLPEIAEIPAAEVKGLAEATIAQIDSGWSLLDCYQAIAAKEGRKLSTARRGRLMALLSQQEALTDAMRVFLEDTAPPEREADPLQMSADPEHARDVAAPDPDALAARHEFQRLTLQAAGA